MKSKTNIMRRQLAEVTASLPGLVVGLEAD